MATQTESYETRTVPVLSVSGARLRPLRPAVASAIFERVVGTSAPSLRSGEAWGAFADRTGAIAACAVERLSETTCRAQVAIELPYRHLGIGRELVEIAMAHAASLGSRRLIGSHKADAADAYGLVASLDATWARRVHGGNCEVVVFLPTSVTLTQEGRL